MSPLGAALLTKARARRDAETPEADAAQLAAYRRLRQMLAERTLAALLAEPAKEEAGA